MLNEYLSWRFEALRVRALASTTGRHDPWCPLRTARCAAVLVAARLAGHPTAVVLHLSSGGSFVREGALVALTRALALPVAVQLHGSDFADFASRWPRLIRKVLRLADQVYVLTDETARIARTSLGSAGAAAVRKIANGVAVPEDLPDKEPIVVFAGQADPRKGVEVLLDAWPAVHARHPGWRLVIAGPVAPDVAGRTVPAAVTMLGTVGRDEVHHWQARAALAVLPSRQEALPMSLLEAMARGCAVVATPVGEVAGLVAGCGLVVEVGDVDLLAGALAALAADPDTTARLGAAARKRITQRYSATAVGAVLQREWAALLDIR